jgi:hypothetical protein
LLVAEAIVVLLGNSLFQERLLPTAFQFASHQTILGLNRMVLSSRTFCLIANAFEALLPMLMEAVSLLLQIRGSAKAYVQSGGLQCTEHLLADERVQDSAD